MPRWSAPWRAPTAVTDPLGDLALALYSVCGAAVRPAVPMILSSRLARGKEEAGRLAERYGEASEPRPSGRLVWVHAASVGETNAILPLVRRLSARGLPVLFTCTTVTAARIAAGALPEGAVQQFAPVDVGAYVRRFLDHWRPDVVIFVESELWPSMLAELKRRGIPQVIVNGRVSDRSFRRWQMLAPIARSLFSRIGMVLARSEEDGARFARLGAADVKVTGNIKFDVPPLAADDAGLSALRAAVSDRAVWLAASTHPGEEEQVAAAHRQLRQSHPDLLTVIVPRHPPRGDAIRDLLTGQGLSVAQRSRGELPGSGTDIYVADTMGELGILFRLSPVVFLGGSLVPHGGHNPIEPLQLGGTALHGPHVHNFTVLFDVIDRVAPDMRVGDATELADAVGRLLQAPLARAQKVAAVNAALQPLQGALDRTMAALDPLLSGTAVR